MSDDPAGHYAWLGVDPAASQAAITAAFRRKAHLLHPDVPGTGDVDAFIRVKAAYDVLGDAHRRGGYDRSARAAAMSEPAPPPTVAQTATRGPRLADLPLALWAGLGGVFCLAVAMVVYQSIRAPAPPRLATALVAPLKAPGPRVAPVPPPAVVAVRGEPTHYVLPAGGPTLLWRRDATRDVYLPSAQVPAFTSVQALRFFPQHGLVEVRLADGSLGVVDAARLTPGDGAAARRAYCAYYAGVAPANGDVLQRTGSGTGHVTMDNRSGQPAVVKLRDAVGSVVATVFMERGGSTTVSGLPDGRYRPDFATGEVWSRACHGFAIGMRAQRFMGDAPLAALSPLVIPPDLSGGAPAVDIPDGAFVRDQGSGG